MIKKIAFLLLLSYASITQAQTLEKDSLILLEFYNSMNGNDGWVNDTNWYRGNLNTWYGVTVSNNRVTQINLPGNNLEGFLPSSLAGLTALTRLDLSSNHLKGTLIVSYMVNLTFVNISNNPPVGQPNYTTPIQFGAVDPNNNP